MDLMFRRDHAPWLLAAAAFKVTQLVPLCKMHGFRDGCGFRGQQ